MKKRYYWLMIPINLIPIALTFVFYRGGILVEIPMFFMECALLTMFNHIVSENVPRVLFLSLFQIVSVVVGGMLSTYLYTKNISADGMSFAIGELQTYAEVIITVIAFLVSTICKYFRKKAAK